MAAQAVPTPPKIIRRPKVEERTGLKRSAIYAKFRPNPKRPSDYDPTFPKPVRIGKKAVGWVESEIDDWLTAQIAKSRPEAAPAPAPEAKPARKLRPLSLTAPVAVLDHEAAPSWDQG